MKASDVGRYRELYISHWTKVINIEPYKFTALNSRDIDKVG